MTEVGERAVVLWHKLIPIGVIALIGWILILICRHAIRRAERRRGDVHLSFFRRLLTGLILLFCVIMALSSLNGVDSIWRTLLSGTAVITAVLAFVAQDVIKDVLAGLTLSIHRPFSVGDRVVLEDGTIGVVADITMRHVLLNGIDSQRICIPNSKISAMRVTDYTTARGDQSIYFTFSVGYESDMELTKQVIAQAIEDCPYSVPGRTAPDGESGYGPVYFVSFADSARILGVTVYYSRATSGMLVIDAINSSVRDALRAHDIEIPYNYVTVVTEEQKQQDTKTNR